MEQALSTDELTACLPATVADLVRETGRDYETILSALRRLEARRLVTRTKHGRSTVWREA